MRTAQEVLDAIWYSTINDINLNLKEREVMIDLFLEEDGEISKHMLKMERCTNFLWIEKPQNEHSYSYEKNDYYELSAATIKRICINSTDKWLKQYALEFNLVIEIWQTALLIKAEVLVVDQERFQII